ncbi:MAG: glycosyl hydrolase family 8 [Lachnospiraceae bacterium]|nr:glycosyl hydrolase family 8 [Lachnospiraceae bacterium]
MYENKEYRNVFKEVGISEEAINKRLEEIKEEYFYGENKVYFDVEPDTGYIMDTGNYDARTEGMSYGMMLCVQLNMKNEFDRIWKWSKDNMFMNDGFHEGYFAWSVKPDLSMKANGPAPDGEEYYALALFFASHRWGDSDGIFNYSHEACEILSAMIHKGNGRVGVPMFNNDNHQILFVPGSEFTDPSYHLPHFYELFSEWAYEEDREFFKEAAKVSREFLVKACHPKTGFSAEYSWFDGSPMSKKLPWTDDRHDWFYSDAYRTAANISLDYEWFKTDVGQCAMGNRIEETLLDDMRNDTYHIYEIDGTVAGEKALHPLGITATVAETALLGPVNELSKEWVLKFFNSPLRLGERRYYDNCLYFFSFLALSGNYRIY